jgi:hypothetical protein
MDMGGARFTLSVIRVRKLTGKPGGHTSPDCGFDARRIHRFYEDCVSFLAAEIKTPRIHSDLLRGDLAIAACIRRLSSGESRAWMRMPRSLAFGTLGRPILGLIKNFQYDENNC